MALSCIIFEIEPDVGRQSRFFHTRLHSTPPPLGGHRGNIALWCGKTRIVWPLATDSEKRLMVCLAVPIEYRRDRQTDGQTDILRQHNSRYA